MNLLKAFGFESRDTTHARAIASKMHEKWREGRKREDGTFEPRLKTTTDEAWSRKNGNKKEVDIANTTFEDLPRDWQEENLLQAEGAIEAHHKHYGPKHGVTFLKKEQLVELMAGEIHSQWVKRDKNPKNKNPQKHLWVEFGKLDDIEKEKDRVIARIAIEEIGRPFPFDK